MSSLSGVAFVVVLAWAGAIAFWHILRVYDDEPDAPGDEHPKRTSIAKPAAEPERRVYDARDDELAFLCGLMFLAVMYIIVRWGG